MQQIKAEKLKLKDKRNTYAKFVKQMYLPSIDVDKRNEIEKRKLKLASSIKVINETKQSISENAE